MSRRLWTIFLVSQVDNHHGEKRQLRPTADSSSRNAWKQKHHCRYPQKLPHTSDANLES